MNWGAFLYRKIPIMHGAWDDVKTWALQKSFSSFRFKIISPYTYLNNKIHNKTKDTGTRLWINTRETDPRERVCTAFVCLHLSFFYTFTCFIWKRLPWELILIIGHTESGRWFPEVTSFLLYSFLLREREREISGRQVKQCLWPHHGSQFSFERLQPSERCDPKYLDLGPVILEDTRINGRLMYFWNIRGLFYNFFGVVKWQTWAKRSCCICSQLLKGLVHHVMAGKAPRNPYESGAH